MKKNYSILIINATLSVYIYTIKAKLMGGMKWKPKKYPEEIKTLEPAVSKLIYDY